ncbi:DUF427 domain-containing protein [Microbispora corallina]|uniref:DUF427 domain-containing protein n=1 Tax=Microbispora corallina TaxID=83302 RepID=A0ABQ4G688_9ACTN|nr:DUF427 domain-containing protein [Microbispora corallina]GIH42569.1 hypothetical protein Mco01_55690 [Microbispora corallina]
MPASDTLNWEPSERWVRGVRGDTTIVDSPHPVLVWEPGHPVPRYAFPTSEVRTDLLRPSANPPVGAHAGATVFYDLLVGDEVVENAAWSYPIAQLSEYIAFEWFNHPGRVLDHWYEEDEEIFVHPRDPYKRIDPIPSSRHVRVEVDGQVVADTRRPVLLFETGLPIRYYIPPDDVNFDLLESTDEHTRCPYKGIASYWSAKEAGTAPPNVAWAYPEPIPAAAQIKDHVAFYNEAVDIIVDGVKLERPTTLFSERLRKLGS